MSNGRIVVPRRLVGGNGPCLDSSDVGSVGDRVIAGELLEGDVEMQAWLPPLRERDLAAPHRAQCMAYLVSKPWAATSSSR